MNLEEAILMAPTVYYNDEIPAQMMPIRVLDGEVELDLEVDMRTGADVTDEDEEFEDSLDAAIALLKMCKGIFSYYIDFSPAGSGGIIRLDDRMKLIEYKKELERFIDAHELESGDVPPDDVSYKDEEESKSMLPDGVPGDTCPKCMRKLIIDRNMMAVYCPQAEVAGTDFTGHYFEPIEEVD